MVCTNVGDKRSFLTLPVVNGFDMDAEKFCKLFIATQMPDGFGHSYSRCLISHEPRLSLISIKVKHTQHKTRHYSLMLLSRLKESMEGAKCMTLPAPMTARCLREGDSMGQRIRDRDIVLVNTLLVGNC